MTVPYSLSLKAPAAGNTVPNAGQVSPTCNASTPSLSSPVSTPSRPPPRQLVGSPFELSFRSPRSKASSDHVPLKTKPPATTSQTQVNDSSPQESPKTDPAKESLTSRRSAASTRSMASRTTVSTVSGSRSVPLPRSRSVDGRIPAAASVTTQSFDDTISWEGESQSCCASPKTPSFCRLRSPRGSSRLSTGTLSALSSTTLDNERRAFEKSLEREHQWLRRALSEEIRRVTAREEREHAHRAWNLEREERQQAEELRRQEQNHKRFDEFVRMRKEQEARREQEQLRAREAAEREFLKFQEHCQAEKRRREEQRFKNEIEAEKHRETEAQLEAKRQEEQSYAEHLRQQYELQAEARKDLLQQQRQVFKQALETKKEARESRMQRALESHHQVLDAQRERIEDQQRKQLESQERLSARQSKEKQEAQEASVILAAKRSEACSTAAQRVKAKRKSLSEKVIVKDDKQATINNERHKIWEMRRQAQIEAQHILRSAKNEAEKQACNSRQYLNWLAEQLERLQNPGSLTHSRGPISPAKNTTSPLFEEDRLAGPRAKATDLAALEV